MMPNQNPSSIRIQDALSYLKPSLAFVIIIFGALVAFEIFNYTTTDHALRDLLGDLRFAGFRWSTILALAFCGIDFAGVARLFTPEQGGDEPKEVWYLFGAWLLAATMNAILTWWGVSMAVITHNVQSTALVDPATLAGVVPVFVAVMVWVIRILIIGTLSIAMDRLLHPEVHARQVPFQAMMSGPNQRQIPATLNSTRAAQTQRQPLPQQRPAPALSRAAAASSRYQQRNTEGDSQRIKQTPLIEEEEPEYIPEIPSRPAREPSYHTLSMSARPKTNSGGSGQSSNTNRFRR